jgi:hypothetical protein
MNFGDGIFGKVSFKKTLPGSKAARDQYRQTRLIVAAQWVLTLFMVGVVIAYSITWGFLVVLGVLSIFGIPAHRRFLRRLRENAYPDGPLDE